MDELCGPHMSKMKYYDCIPAKVNGCDVMVSASGFSTELGYEIYLRDATKNAEKMWYTMLEAGKKHNLRVIAPGHHRRIEAGILSFGADMDQETNPYECGLGWQVDLTKEAFIGKNALAKIKEKGVTHKLAGLKMGGEPITWYAADFYHVFKNDELVGYVTSAWYSPTQESNIGYAMLPVELTELGTELEVALPDLYKSDKTAPTVKGVVEKTPFKPPAKGNEGHGLRTTGTKL